MESDYEEAQVSSRNAKSAKEIPTKVIDLEQWEKHDPRLVSLCKKSHKRSIEDGNKLKNRWKARNKWNSKLFLIKRIRS